MHLTDLRHLGVSGEGEAVCDWGMATGAAFASRVPLWPVGVSQLCDRHEPEAARRGSLVISVYEGEGDGAHTGRTRGGRTGERREGIQGNGWCGEW